MDPFIIQFISWGTALALSAFAAYRFNSAIQQQRKLPAATKLLNLETIVEQKQQELDDIRNQLDAAQKIIAASTVAEAKITDAKERYEALCADLLKLEADRKEQEVLRGLVEIAKQELVALEESKKALDAKIIELNKEIGALTGKQSAAETQLASAQAELQRLKDEFGIKSAEFQAILADLAQKKTQAELQLRQAELLTLNAKNATTLAEKQLREVTDKLAVIEKKTEDAEKKLRDILKQQKEAEEEIQRLKRQEEELRKRISELRGEVSTATLTAGGEESSANRYEDLWKTAQFQPIKLEVRKIAEADALKKAKKYIADCGLTFPDRVINAFHASLKTADMSPLVVLAGISGTGKSELPMRYAEGMGIHLVSLAVQPRWDSPNDLFGFYNHLEKRYKATELARAMIQFERHNQKDWPLPEKWQEKNNKSEGMLLVLLDEMNLARVEYYFSEFLSKLETRRGVNTTKESDRAKAEIALDMGSLKLDEKAIKIYPDKNVLFAGTMNEDESTQSLSDKVLDRACVMRFGRPRDLTIRPEASRARPSVNLEGLTYRQWEEWCNCKLSSEELDKVQKWIKRLNDIMEKLNRPFGHRVGQAIAQYVANYPRDNMGNDPIKRLNFAMADQIEQRILPKLRGIDLEEQSGHIAEIRALVDELKDASLLKAFDASSNKEANTFIWRGVDRSGE